MSWLLIFSLNTFASWTTANFFPQSWASEALCKQLGQGECYEIIESEEKYNKKTIQVDDTSKPIYSNKQNKVVCDGAEDCKAKAPACVLPYFQVIKDNYKEAYCIKINSYEKMDKVIIYEDANKVIGYNQKKAQELSDKVEKEAKKNKVKDALKKAIKSQDSSLTNQDLEDL